MLSPKAINDLKKIHQEETGVVLTDQEVLEMGTRLLMMFKGFYQSIQSKEAYAKVK
jgi:hypothetical protein